MSSLPAKGVVRTPPSGRNVDVHKQLHIKFFLNYELLYTYIHNIHISHHFLNELKKIVDGKKLQLQLHLHDSRALKYACLPADFESRQCHLYFDSESSTCSCGGVCFWMVSQTSGTQRSGYFDWLDCSLTPFIHLLVKSE